MCVAVMVVKLWSRIYTGEQGLLSVFSVYNVDGYKNVSFIFWKNAKSTGIL